MTRQGISSMASPSRILAAVAGVLVTAGLAVSLQAAAAMAADPAAGTSDIVAPAVVTPALPPTDPAYILARLESDHLRRISKAWWYTSALVAAEARRCAAFLARFETDYLRHIARRLAPGVRLTPATGHLRPDARRRRAGVHPRRL